MHSAIEKQLKKVLKKKKKEAPQNNFLFRFRAVRFVVFHICTLFITVSLSLSMGIITGMFVHKLVIYISWVDFDDMAYS